MSGLPPLTVPEGEALAARLRERIVADPDSPNTWSRFARFMLARVESDLAGLRRHETGPTHRCPWSMYEHGRCPDYRDRSDGLRATEALYPEDSRG